MGYLSEEKAVSKLTKIMGLNKEAATRLFRAGINSIKKLRSSNPDELSKITGIAKKQLITWIILARAQERKKFIEVDNAVAELSQLIEIRMDDAKRLVSAGVMSVEELADEPADLLSQDTGMPVELLINWIRKAREIKKLPPEIIRKNVEMAIREIRNYPLQRINLVLNKKYKIMKFLGSGATADTYLAEEIDTHKKFAIKIYRDWVLKLPNEFDRITRVVDTMRNIDYPNIMAVIGYNAHREGELSLVYLLMEYLDGTTLTEFIKNSKVLEDKNIFTILYQICCGLKVLHDNKIIHRDLKPDNIMVLKRDNKLLIKLMDFGVIKNLNETSITESGQFLGTLRYSSPEWVFGEKTDFKTDIYSVGAILYKLLGGKDPFYHKRNRAAIIKEILPKSDIYESQLFKIGNENNFPTSFFNLGRKLTAHPSNRPNIDEVLELMKEMWETESGKKEIL